LLHAIEPQLEDVAGPFCLNAAAAGVAVGDRIVRSDRRLSIVLVHKLMAGGVGGGDG
jgi:hypothetical protein